MMRHVIGDLIDVLDERSTFFGVRKIAAERGPNNWKPRLKGNPSAKLRGLPSAVAPGVASRVARALCLYIVPFPLFRTHIL